MDHQGRNVGGRRRVSKKKGAVRIAFLTKEKRALTEEKGYRQTYGGPDFSVNTGGFRERFDILVRDFGEEDLRCRSITKDFLFFTVS